MTHGAAQPIAAAVVPVIDVAPLRDGSDPLPVAREIHRAVSEVGILYVRGHGVPDGLIERARSAALRFFRQPRAAKLAVAARPWHRGYLAVGDAKMDDDAEQDLKESFIWGRELSAEEARAAEDNPVLGPNVWPESQPELKDAVLPYFEAAHGCARDLMRAFAIALGLPEGTFMAGSETSLSRASIVYYPPQPAARSRDRFGVGPHTDFGVLTVLCQDDVGGLEVQTVSGDWVAAPPIEGSLVVNVGDLLQRWSNGRFRSPPHRVVNRSGRERLSLVVAYDPSAETVIDPAVVCADGETPEVAPITCGDYLTWRFGRAFSYRRD